MRLKPLHGFVFPCELYSFLLFLLNQSNSTAVQFILPVIKHDSSTFIKTELSVFANELLKYKPKRYEWIKIICNYMWGTSGLHALNHTSPRILKPHSITFKILMLRQWSFLLCGLVISSNGGGLNSFNTASQYCSVL